MMTQRFNLFYAGFSAFVPVLYFSRLSLASRHSENTEEVLPCVKKLLVDTLCDRDENISHLRTAESIASHFGIQLKTLPEDFTQFFPWLTHLTDEFDRHFPMSKIDHYYFLYSRKMAELYCNAGLIQTYIDLHLHSKAQLNMQSGIEKCLRDSEYILFKLVASSALLSSEPRHAFLSTNYKSVNEDFQAFRRLSADDLGEGSLQKLSSGMGEFSLKVKEGFKRCIGHMKELQS